MASHSHSHSHSRAERANAIAALESHVSHYRSKTPTWSPARKKARGEGSAAQAAPCCGSCMAPPKQRVFTITGFDSKELFGTIGVMPSAVVVDCKPNLPIPANITHLVTTGQLTVKLLTALVRGCWVVP